MEIVVCIKQVPGTNKVEVDEKTGVLKRAGVESKMNPYDLFAIEAAVRLKEKHGGTITAVTMGPNQAEGVLREAFAMGADCGVLLTDRRFAGADVLATSYALAQGILACCPEFDIIICGKQTTDGDTAQVGPEISEWLDVPAVCCVSAITESSDKKIGIELELGDSIQKAEVDYPCLITVDKDIYMPRLPSYKKKKQSADRKIKILTLNDLSDTDETKYGLTGSPTQVQRIYPPKPQGQHETWSDSEEEIADRLFEKLVELKFI